MRVEWLIIDGYNLLHQVEELTSLLRTDLLRARQRLVRFIENTAHRMAPRTTIVFDGRQAGTDEALSTELLEIIFSPGNLTADTVIERLVSSHSDPEHILVATSDHAEHATVSGAGAQVISAQEFIAQCRLDGRRSIGRRMPPGQSPRLGDLFPNDWPSSSDRK